MGLDHLRDFVLKHIGNCIHGCDPMEVKCQHIIEDHQMLGFFRFGYGHILLDLG